MNRIYYMRTDIFESQINFDLAKSLISESRKAALDSQNTDSGKRGSLSASYLLHVACCDAGIPEELRKLTVNEYGKPQFASDTGFHFSLSHSKDLAVCAISDGAVGIDTEGITPRDIRIADRFFTEDERRFITELPEANRSEAFFRIWTMKECYVKALGCGFNKSPMSFSVPISRELCVQLPYNGLYISEYRVGDGLIALCAASGKQFSLNEISTIK